MQNVISIIILRIVLSWFAVLNLNFAFSLKLELQQLFHLSTAIFIFTTIFEVKLHDTNI